MTEGLLVICPAVIDDEVAEVLDVDVRGSELMLSVPEVLVMTVTTPLVPVEVTTFVLGLPVSDGLVTKVTPVPLGITMKVVRTVEELVAVDEVVPVVAVSLVEPLELELVDVFPPELVPEVLVVVDCPEL